MGYCSESELILNDDGSVFHLRLFPEQIADQIILVGNPARVAMIGEFLQKAETLASNREFISLSGYYNNCKITVVSTGIGTDNIDIVVNELDALVNIDFKSRCDKTEARSLRLIRIGTSGSLQPDLPVGASVSSAWSIGLDGLMHYYEQLPDPERAVFEKQLMESVGWPDHLPRPYAVKGSAALLEKVKSFCTEGITIAAHGFYGPQGRRLRIPLSTPDLNSRLRTFSYQGLRTTNFEMESSALYGLSQQLNHQALTVCLIIANRQAETFLCDYDVAIRGLILNTLNAITN